MTGPVADPVPADAPGSREIGFAKPARYNASAILFDNLAAGRGDRIAVHAEDGSLSYAALCARACRIGNALLSLGLSRGDRVLLYLDDTPAYPAALFGAIRAGLVPMLVNTQSTADLLRFYLEDSGARAVIVDAAFAGLFTAELLAGSGLAGAFAVNGPPPGGSALRDGDAWFAGFPDDLPAADTHADEMCFWMYSSGSTGRPKGVVHLQHDMPFIAASYGRHVLQVGPGDICFSVPKIFFAYGFGNALVFPFAVGAATVLLAGRPTPQRVFDAVSRHRPTLFFGLPTLYTALVHDPAAEAADLSSLRLCISAAEILSAEIFDLWQARFGHRIVEGLGSTEVLHIYLSNTPEAQKRGAAGRRVPGYELKLTDRDGAPVADGAEGILWVRGDSASPCYWNRPDKTAETMRDGWIWTGDRFAVDEDGFHFFRGRADDLIKVSGQWVYPLEIELCLAEHPDVRECAVLPVELADRRMTLRAFVVLGPQAAPGDTMTKRLQDYVKGRLLPYKYPRELVYVAELPKTGTGKIDRQALRRVGG
ncbi:MAG: benzoate-CoA ligase family protein [Sneathiellaceae bacterium]